MCTYGVYRLESVFVCVCVLGAPACNRIVWDVLVLQYYAYSIVRSVFIIATGAHSIVPNSSFNMMSLLTS